MPSMRPLVGDAIEVTVYYAAATESIGKPCRTGHSVMRLKNRIAHRSVPIYEFCQLE